MKAERKVISPGKRLRFRLEAAVLRALEWLLTRFSRRAVTRAGSAVGWLAYHIAPGLRRIALANLDVAFGDSKSPEEKRRIARASLQNFGRTMFGLFWSSRVTQENFRQYVEVDPASLKTVREVQERGAAVMIITLHYGDWELLGLAVGFLGIRMTIVQEAKQNVLLEDILARLRSGARHRMVPAMSSAMTLLKTLKSGGNVGTLVDLNAFARSGGAWLDFFGLPAYNHTAFAALALRTGATVFCVVGQPLPGGRIRVEISDPIEPPHTAAPEAQVRALSQKCLTHCEQVIRRNPDYWLWTYKRWKYRPHPEPGRYPFYSKYEPSTMPQRP